MSQIRERYKAWSLNIDYALVYLWTNEFQSCKAPSAAVYGIICLEKSVVVCTGMSLTLCLIGALEGFW